MPTKISFTVIIFSLFSFSSWSQRVLMIGIDGCRSDVADTAITPSLDNLKNNGLFSYDALNDDITISGPGWSGIVCGVWSDKHLVTDNSFNGSNYQQFPSFFHRIENHDSSLNTVSICHWSPINDNIVQTDADVTINVSSDAAVAQEAINQFDNADPHAVFLHFDEADYAGHADGFSPSVPQYVETIEDIDSLIGTVLTALENRPNYSSENWIVLVSSDHGGINTSHGGNTFEEENVIFIASGDSIPFEEIVRDSSFTVVQNCLQDTVDLSFDGIDDYIQIGHDPVFDFGATDDFTIECRVKTTVAGDVSIVGNKDWDSGNNKGVVFSFKFPAGPEWKVNIGDGANRADINTGGQIADGEWHTLSVSFDRDGMMKMYEDGIFIAETDMSGVGDIDNGEDFFVGTDIDIEYDFEGAVAELRIWDGILSAQSISDYACVRLDNMHPSYNQLIGYWKMNETSGTQVLDDSSNNNDGTINNANWITTDSVWMVDFDHTPRIVDMPVTALAHLCIPIDPTWSLDGDSWVDDCVYNDRDCANPKSNIYIGPTTGTWHNDDHWSRGFIPKICDHVVIETGNNVSVELGQLAECYTLYVASGAELDVVQGAELNVLIPD